MMPITAKAVTASVHVASTGSLRIVLLLPVLCRNDHRSHALPFIPHGLQATRDAARGEPGATAARLLLSHPSGATDGHVHG
jgi:hypothetical protein